MSEFYNMDCMDGMKQFPDGHFDLAIVDPPYGIGVFSMTYTKEGKLRKAYGNSVLPKTIYRNSADWDMKPDKRYFDELFRVSKKQIVWGGNYFSDLLYPSKSFVVWDKRAGNHDRNAFADCEYAWLSSGMGVGRMYRYLWSGMIQGGKREKRIHPTQKPTALYMWLLTNYAKEGDLILDTHVGSGSSLVACERLGFQYVGYEIDAEYYNLAKARIEEEINQISLYRTEDQEIL